MGEDAAYKPDDGKGSITQNVIVGVVTAVVLGGLGLIYNWASPSQGGLIHLLGGITPKEAEDIAKKVVGPAPPLPSAFPPMRLSRSMITMAVRTLALRGRTRERCLRVISS
jgi:hypothetical protein